MKDIFTMLSLTRTAWFLLASGVFHVGVWLFAGMPSLEGPVSWRKPITFGFSTGLLLLSLAWIVSLLPASRRRDRQAGALAALLVAEIALIDMQQWRGVASHFNNATPFDGAVFTMMGVLIVGASVIMALWTRDVFREPLSTTPAYASAARAGMVMLNLGNVIGLAMAVTQSTSLKPFHGVTLHVLQALPIAIWIVTRLRYPLTWPIAARGWRWRWSPWWQHR
jgi:hypothetical protein